MEMTSEKDNQEELPESVTETAPTEVGEEEEDSLSIEELEAEVSRLRTKVTKLQALLWKLGYDKEGKKIL